jgi:hypothetical protein
VVKECNMGCDKTLGVHCWRVVNYKGQIGFVGCHENFTDSTGYWMHLSRGACRNPDNVDKLRWNGVSWEVKEEDQKRR